MGLFDFFKKNHKSNTEKLDEVPKYPANISVPPEDIASEEVYNVFISDCEERKDAFGNSHKVGGYRYSTQFGSWDYDCYTKENKIDIHADDADVLLFQLTSDYAPVNFETRTHDWIKVMWCDAGVGRFTIKRCDLKNVLLKMRGFHGTALEMRSYYVSKTAS